MCKDIVALVSKTKFFYTHQLGNSTYKEKYVY